MFELTEDEIELIRLGMHNFYCLPMTPVLEGPKKGRMRKHPERQPPRGQCACVGQELRYYRHYPDEYVTIQL